MPNVIFNGEPMNGTADSDVIVDIPGWEGPASTIYGNGGADLILGDGELVGPSFLFNTSLANSANIDLASLWSNSTANPLIDGAGPHNSYYMDPVAGARHYFSVTVGAGETLTADVDFASSAWGGYTNAVLDILNGSGTVVATNDNGTGDVGSLSILDPLVSYTAAAAGTYTIRVREAGTADGGVFEGNEQLLLNVAVTGHAATGASIVGGSDTIGGGDGDDVIFGMLGVDFVHGDAGNDTIASTGDGSYYGDAGNDTIHAGLTFSGETLNGGSGTDTLNTTSFDGDYVVNLATGLTNFTSELFVNFERLTSGAGDDTLTGTAGNNVIDGGAGNDVIDGAGGADTCLGGLGNDQYTVDDPGDVAEERPGAGTDTVFASVSFALGAANAVEYLRTTAQTGTAAIDLTGSASANVIVGNDGINVLDGGDGDDRLYGRAGNDTLQGGLGDDILYGAAGDDQFVVESQGDIVVETAGYGTDTVFALTSYALASNAAVESLTTLQASTGAIDLTGNGFDQAIVGNDGVNTLTGGGGMDALKGLAGADLLRGSAGRDTLSGGGGADVIDGGAGTKDSLTGGAGSDRFLFRDGDMAAARYLADTITDFSQANNEKIDLHFVDADTGAAGDQAFSFIGGGGFTGVAGQLHAVQDGGATYVEGDTDGDGTADFVIALTGLHTLAATDFVL